MSKVVNLADRRRFVQKDDPDAPIEQQFPPHIQAGIAKIRIRQLLAEEEYRRLQQLAKSFRPSGVPALENAALFPLFNLRFNNATLRELFLPRRSKLYGAEYSALFKRFGLYLHTSSMSDPSEHFEVWVMFGELLRTDRLRAAYGKTGVNWIDAIVSAPVELKLKKPPQDGMYKARALLLIPRKVGA